MSAPTTAQLEAEWVALRDLQRRCEEAIAQRDELLAALQSCLDYGAMTGDEWVTDKARAAIAKAEGRS